MIDSWTTGMSASGKACMSTDHAPWSIPQLSTSAPTQVGYGQSFDIASSGPAVSRAVLMSPSSTTHAVEMNARHIELAVTPNGTGFTATAPPDARVAPPGYYMLFVLTPDGVPSVASWVHVGP